jgi:hypothetical protein
LLTLKPALLLSLSNLSNLSNLKEEKRERIWREEKVAIRRGPLRSLRLLFD